MHDVALEGFTAPKDDWMDPVPNLIPFMRVYEKHLRSNLAKDPGGYGYGLDKVGSVMTVMSTAIRRDGSFQTINKDTPSIRGTCRELGIKHTYRAIDAYLKGVTA